MAVNRINNNGIIQSTGAVTGKARPGSGLSVTRKDFSSFLNTAIQGTADLKFSRHAAERMEERGIALTPRQMDRVRLALEKAERKGLKESLIVVDETALVVSVKNKTVITVAGKSELTENVFTNIDGAVFS